MTSIELKKIIPPHVVEVQGHGINEFYTPEQVVEILSSLGAVRFEQQIKLMEVAILENLTNLEDGYGRRKQAISKQTGIPEDILTVLLKRLKLEGKVKLVMIFSECTSMPNGSGYCLVKVN